MSEDGFHVHGPHDHALDHATEHAADAFSARIAAITAVMATLGAIFSYQGGATQNDALMFKNEAAIKKTEASDQWAYYQAKSSKQNMAVLAVALTSGATQEKFKNDISRYELEKGVIKSKAEVLEQEADKSLAQSGVAEGLHHRWALAMTAIQIAISLLAIALLSRKAWLQWVGLGISVLALLLGLSAVF